MSKVYSSPAAYWLEKIEGILEKYESKSGLKVFNAAFDAITVEEGTRASEEAIKDIAMIIGHCKQAIIDTVASKEFEKKCELRTDQQLVGRQSSRAQSILSTLDSVKRSEVAE